jgi:hypothetical protein
MEPLFTIFLAKMTIAVEYLGDGTAIPLVFSWVMPRVEWPPFVMRVANYGTLFS